MDATHTNSISQWETRVVWKPGMVISEELGMSFGDHQEKKSRGPFFFCSTIFHAEVDGSEKESKSEGAGGGSLA